MKRFTLVSGALVVLILTTACIEACHSAASTSNSTTGAVNGASGQAQAAAATGVQWVTVRDTRENAFSIQVPQGWKTYGGLFRYSNIDARMVVNMTSPDGLTNLQIGDSTVPPYRVPGPMLPTGPGVAPYVTAKIFATKYGQARFASMCQGMVVTKSDDMAPKYHPAQQGMSHTTGGDVYFSCTKNGTQMVGGGAGKRDRSGGPGHCGRRNAATFGGFAGNESGLDADAKSVEQPGDPANQRLNAGDDRCDKCGKCA
jgi:hypothetical protein